MPPSAIAAALVWIGVTAAASDHHALTFEEQLRQDLEWIAENSRFEYDGTSLPRVLVASQDLLMAEVYGLADYVESLSTNTSYPAVNAIYQHHQDAILFTEEMDPFIWQNRDVLVHELVHFLQDQAGLLFTGKECPGDQELEAHEITDAWAAAHDHPYENRLDDLSRAFYRMSCSKEMPYERF